MANFKNTQENELFLFTFVTGHIWNDVPKNEIAELVDSEFESISKSKFDEVYSEAFKTM